MLGAQATPPPKENKPAGKPNFDTFIPDDIYAYISMDNMPQWTDIAKKSFLNKLWNDPEVQKFTTKVNELIQKEFSKEANKETKVKIDEVLGLADVFTSQIAVILDSVELKISKKKIQKPQSRRHDPEEDEDDESSNKPEFKEVEELEVIPHAIALGRVNQNKNKLDALIEKVLLSAKEKNIVKKAEDYKGVSYFTLYENKESTKVSYGYMDDIFFIAYGDKGLKRTIERYKNPESGKALNTKIAYQKLMGELGPNKLSTIYINCPPLVATAKQAILKDEISRMESYRDLTPEKIDTMNKTATKIVDLTGIGDIKSIVAGSYFDGEGIVSVSLMDVPGAKRGIWKLLSSAPVADFKTLKMAPKNTSLYLGLSFSPTEGYDEVMNVLSNLLEKSDYEEMQEGLKEMHKEIGLRLREDILPLLGNELAMIFGSAPADDKKNMMTAMIPFSMAYAVSISQPDKFKQAHDQILAKAGEKQKKSPLAEKKYKGFTFYVMEMPSFSMNPEEEEEEPEPSELFGYFFTKDLFVFSIPGTSYLKAVADALSGEGKDTLASSPDFVKIANKVKTDSKKISIVYLDWMKYVEMYGSIFKMMSFGGMHGGKEGFESLMGEFPSWDVLKKYFINCKTYQYMYPVPDGFMAREYTKIILD
jgi:hypothetical protein